LIFFNTIKLKGFSQTSALGRLFILALILFSSAQALKLQEPLPLLDLQPEKVAVASGETPVRRFDILFFIALPFAILYSTLADTLFSTATGIKIGLDRKSTGSATPFVYPDASVNGNVLFIGMNAVIWSGVIAFNDFYEKEKPLREDYFKNFLSQARSDIYLFRSYF
jgi:hypothetical protein